MNFELLLLRILKSGIVLFGLILAYLSLKSYYKTKSKNMFFLALGFSIITVGKKKIIAIKVSGQGASWN